jgi:hypothetical protein
MDGSPQVVRFDATTLWHVDAAEWAPSTASNSVSDVRCTTGFSTESGSRSATLRCRGCAKTGNLRRAIDAFLFERRTFRRTACAAEKDLPEVRLYRLISLFNRMEEVT